MRLLLEEIVVFSSFSLYPSDAGSGGEDCIVVCPSIVLIVDGESSVSPLAVVDRSVSVEEKLLMGWLVRHRSVLLRKLLLLMLPSLDVFRFPVEK